MPWVGANAKIFGADATSHRIAHPINVAMSRFARLVAVFVIATAVLHTFPVFALAAGQSWGDRACHHHENSKPGRATDLCCAVHRSVVVQSFWVPNRPAQAMAGFDISLPEHVSRVASQNLARVAPEASRPGTEPLRI